MTRSGVRLLRNSVEKWGPPESIRCEASKLEKAYAIGNETGIFRVPRLLEVDANSGYLRMERIPGLRGLRRAGLNRAEYFSIVQQAGVALAEIHQRLWLHEGFRYLLPSGLGSGGPNAFIHGDYSVENVAVAPGPRFPELVLIDWQSSPRLGGVATYGPAFFDIAWFVGNLFRKPIYRYFIDPHAEQTAQMFLSAYSEVSKINLAEFGLYLERLLRFRLDKFESILPAWKSMLLTQGFTKWGAFARNLKTEADNE